MAELLPKDQRGQMLLLATIAAITTGYVLWQGFSPIGIDGMKQYAARRDTMQQRIDTLERRVQRAKSEVAQGTAQQLRERLDQHRNSLALMSQLVPASGEVPNLLDDITSRARARGAAIIGVTPQPLESSAPFDVMRQRYTVTGLYDQVGEFLADIASLPRIVVPYGVSLAPVTGSAADTASASLLQVSFTIRTFVKPTPEPGAAGQTPAPAGGPRE